MNKLNTTGIVILAAGPSSRLGQSKQLLEHNGRSLLEHAAGCARVVPSSSVCVVLGARAAEHQKVLDDPSLNIVINEAWTKGMGSSIKAGVRFFVDKVPSVQGVIIMVCDQPFVSTRHLHELILTHQQMRKPIIASGYAGSAGVPAFFDVTVFDELTSLDDSAGAKKIISADPARVLVIPFTNGEIDIDTEDDVKRWLSK